jgi:hypothetical protein
MIALKIQKYNKMNTLRVPTEIWLNIFNFLDDDQLWAIMNSCVHFARIISSSHKILRRFRRNIPTQKEQFSLKFIPFKNVRLSVNNLQSLHLLLDFKFIESLEVENLRSSSQDIISLLNNCSLLKTIKFKNCNTLNCGKIQINSIMSSNLENLAFEKCNKEYFGLFKHLSSIVKVAVYNYDWTWNGFSHEDFNDLCITLPSLTTIELKGIGTGSYFDGDQFNYQIKKLYSTLITFNWYVGLSEAHPRINFLTSMKSCLKELKIDELPYDFDGGSVLRYIIEEMNLESFYLRSSALILDSCKQSVSNFSACEIQIKSLYEMFRQFPTINELSLILCKTDICSSSVERVFMNSPNLTSVNTLNVNDKSHYRCILGVFLIFFQKFPNLRILNIQTIDRNINVLLEVFLPYMPLLEEINLNLKIHNLENTRNIISSIIPNARISLNHL